MTVSRSRSMPAASARRLGRTSLRTASSPGICRRVPLALITSACPRGCPLRECVPQNGRELPRRRTQSHTTTSVAGCRPGRSPVCAGTPSRSGLRATAREPQSRAVPPRVGRFLPYTVGLLRGRPTRQSPESPYGPASCGGTWVVVRGRWGAIGAASDLPALMLPCPTRPVCACVRRCLQYPPRPLRPGTDRRSRTDRRDRPGPHRCPLRLEQHPDRRPR